MSILEFYSLKDIKRYGTTGNKENNDRNDVNFDTGNIVSTPYHTSFLDT